MEKTLINVKRNVQSLDKPWKELLYSASGFGPNFLMVLMGAFFSDAVNPAGFGTSSPQGQTIVGSICLVVPALFSVLMIVAKVFDGLIDIPFASVTDNLTTRWGRRRPPIAVCFIPMVLSFAFIWIPVFGTEESAQLANTIWFIFWALVFFSTYTMSLIAFYGSLSNVCRDESQRLRVSSYKSFFDTISYCVVYALVPIILRGMSAAGMGIDEFVFFSLPLMCTMLIPLFMIKEGKKYGYPENNGSETHEKISLGKSFKITFKNKLFTRWLVVNCCSFFGLQMFLVAMNTMIVGGMGFGNLEMAMCNTCAFAPVPIMLYLFTKLKNKKGIRFTYQTCLLSFAVAIMSFFFASTFVCGTDNKPLQYVIACVGGVIGSWAIGSFFMMPYMIPAQISSVEEKLTGRNHSAMYFAAQAFSTSVVGAIASYGVYDILKNIFFAKSHGPVWAEATDALDAAAVAAQEMGVDGAEVYNFGVFIVPFIVAALCIAGFFFAFRMPRNYDPKSVALEFKKMDPSIDISAIVAEGEEVKQKGEVMFVQIGLWVLSGALFGFIWAGFIFRRLKETVGCRLVGLMWALCCFIPFASIFVLLKKEKELSEKIGANGTLRKVLLIISGIILPVLAVNLVALILLQKDLNKNYRREDEAAV